MRRVLEKELAAGMAAGRRDKECHVSGPAEKSQGTYVARAELVLARPDHRRLAAASLTPDPLQMMAAACARIDSGRGERADLIVDLIPVSGRKVARWRRQLVRHAALRGPSAYGEQFAAGSSGSQARGVFRQVLAELSGGSSSPSAREASPQRARQADLAEGVGKFLPDADSQVFAVQVLVRVEARHAARARTLLHQVMAVMDAWRGENWWRPVGPRRTAWSPYSNVWWRRGSFDRRYRTGEFRPSKRQWVTVKEIAALLKPASMRCEAVNVVRTGGVVPPAPAQLPEWTGQPGVVPLGRVRGADGRVRLAAVPQADVLFGASFGKSGFGKSELALLQAVSLAYGGTGTWFLDPHGAAAKRAMPYITHPALRKRVWLIDLSAKDPTKRVGSWNPLSMEGRTPAEAQDVIGAVVGGLAAAQGWGDGAPRAHAILSHAVQVLVHLALEMCQRGRPDLQPTLFSIIRLLTDEEWREEVLQYLPVRMRRFWHKTFPRYEGHAVPVVTQTIQRLETSDSLRAFLGQPQSAYDMRYAMDTSKIVLLRCSGTGAADQVITSLLLFDLFRAGCSREGIDQDQLAPMFAFCDELTAIDGASRGYVAAILEQLRKYELRLMGMTQMAMRLSSDTRMALMQNQSLLSASAADSDEAVFVTKRMDPVAAQTLVSLPKWNYVMSTMLRGERTTPFRVAGVPLDEVFAQYHHPELLPDLERAVDSNLCRRTVCEILQELDGDESNGRPGLDDRILTELNALSPARAQQTTIPALTSGSEIG